MAVDNVVTQSSVGLDGNAYTSSVSNDKLTNDDFLKLMLEEMKQQDPTKPMDSKALMDSQLQMSSIQANQDMSNAMTALKSSYENSALSTAANMIGHTVKNGALNSDGSSKKYTVETVQSKDGELYLSAKEIIGKKDALKDSETNNYLDYDENGYIFENGAKTDVRVSLDGDTRFEYNSDGSLKLIDTDNEVITDKDITSKYLFAGTFDLHSETNTQLQMNTIQEIS